MVLALKSLPMVIFIRENIKKESLMGKENMFGRMAHLMKVPLLKAVDKDMEVGNLHEVEVMYIMEDMKKIKKVGMEGIFGRMAASMKEILKTIWSKIYVNIEMEKEELFIEMERKWKVDGSWGILRSLMRIKKFRIMSNRRWKNRSIYHRFWIEKVLMRNRISDE